MITSALLRSMIRKRVRYYDVTEDIVLWSEVKVK